MAKKGKKEEVVEEAEAVEQSTLSDRERKHFEEIRELEAKCDRLEGEFETAKAEASVAKKRLEEAILTLRSTIRRGPDAQLQLPLGEDDWKTTPIGEALQLTEKDAELLQGAGVDTVRDFEEIRAGENPFYPVGLTDILGVGQAKAEKWENEILDWIGKNVNQSPAEAAPDEDGQRESDLSKAFDEDPLTGLGSFSRASDDRRERGHGKPKRKARAK